MYICSACKVSCISVPLQTPKCGKLSAKYFFQSLEFAYSGLRIL